MARPPDDGKSMPDTAKSAVDERPAKKTVAIQPVDYDAAGRPVLLDTSNSGVVSLVGAPVDTGDAAGNLSPDNSKKLHAFAAPTIVVSPTSAADDVKTGRIVEDTKNLTVTPDQKANAPAKVVLKPGHSMVHWLNLVDSGKDFSGLGKPERKRRITLEELATHDKTDDAWIAVSGNVYNVTQFLEYHPGGSEVLDEWLGKNGTSIFMYHHPFVNHERLLRPCQVGILVPSTISPT